MLNHANQTTKKLFDDDENAMNSDQLEIVIKFGKVAEGRGAAPTSRGR